MFSKINEILWKSLIYEIAIAKIQLVYTMLTNNV